MNNLKRAALAVFAAAALSGCSYTDFVTIINNYEPDGNLNVYYIDVGQGDSEYIELPNGRNMLIDAGTSESGEIITDFIEEKGMTKLDYVVATHPHADHIGSMTEVLNTFEVGVMYMPDASADTRTFEVMLDTIEDKGIAVKQAKAGETIFSEDGLSADILAPNGESYEELNDYSAVIKLNYGQTSFLFMGDAEKLSESEIKSDVSCDVIKVGHHGSKTSSSPDFVKRTEAKYAIISVGEDNSYGLPKDEVIKRWENAGAEVLRTDYEGTICFTSDGVSVKRKEIYD